MIEDLSGKSLALFFKKSVEKILNAKSLKKIKDYSIKNKTDARICLHNDKNKGPQVMMISKYRNNLDKNKFFHHKEKKFFLILEGVLILNNKKKKIELSKNKNFCIFTKKKNTFSSYSKSKTSLYLEIIFRN